MGRRKKDAIIKDVTGAKERPEVTVHVPAEAPPMPAYFKENADLAGVWIEVVTDLDRLNVLSRTDSGTVEGYCICLERMRRLQKRVIEEGESYLTKTKDGPRRFKNPDVGTLMDTIRQLKQYAIEMGCTPASRSKVPSLIQKDLFERDNNRFAGFN